MQARQRRPIWCGGSVRVGAHATTGGLASFFELAQVCCIFSRFLLIAREIVVERSANYANMPNKVERIVWEDSNPNGFTSIYVDRSWRVLVQADNDLGRKQDMLAPFVSEEGAAWRYAAGEYDDFLSLIDRAQAEGADDWLQWAHREVRRRFPKDMELVARWMLHATSDESLRQGGLHRAVSRFQCHAVRA